MLTLALKLAFAAFVLLAWLGSLVAVSIHERRRARGQLEAIDALAVDTRHDLVGLSNQVHQLARSLDDLDALRRASRVVEAMTALGEGSSDEVDVATAIGLNFPDPGPDGFVVPMHRVPKGRQDEN